MPRETSPWRPSAHFGEMIRVARCGWGWSEEHGCYLRFSDAPRGGFLVEACPADKLPGDARAHRAWWEGSHEGKKAMLEACAPLRELRNPTQPQSWVVGEDGQVVR